MGQNIILLFLQENLTRLKTKSPTFFKVWAIVSTVLVLITGIPAFLNMFGVTIPDLWSDKVTQAVAWASRASLFMSLLSTQSKAVAVDESGALLKKTDEKNLPFTATVETKKALKEDLPIVTETTN